MSFSYELFLPHFVLGLLSIRSAIRQAAEGFKASWWELSESNDYGEFMFPGLKIKTSWAFVLLWMVTFLVAFYFEACKVGLKFGRLFSI